MEEGEEQDGAEQGPNLAPRRFEGVGQQSERHPTPRNRRVGRGTAYPPVVGGHRHCTVADGLMRGVTGPLGNLG